jgi:Protein of unknown function (DUF4241)
MNLPAFNAAFREGSDFETEGPGKFAVTVREIGTLHLPSGNVVACDPLVTPERPPFTKIVPPGCYPVYVSIAKYGDDAGADERIACAILRFTTKIPSRWEMALLPTQDANELNEDEFFGYPVDAGVGCFMDEETAKALCKKMDEVEDYYELIIDALDETYIHTRSWADFRVGGHGEQNLVVFSSGMGDGMYPSYWGYECDGELAQLITDFQLLPLATRF